jgi:hypothetical protein
MPLCRRPVRPASNNVLNVFPTYVREASICNHYYPWTRTLQASTASTSHLLVVDDDRETCDLLSLYLSEQGFDVSTVEDEPTGRLTVSGFWLSWFLSRAKNGAGFRPAPEWRKFSGGLLSFLDNQSNC